MLITSDGEHTSASAHSLDGMSLLYPALLEYAGMSHMSPVLVACRGGSGDFTSGVAGAFSGKRAAYSAQLTINSPSVTSFISAAAGTVRYACYGYATLEPLFFESVRARVASDTEEFDLLPCRAWTTGPQASAHEAILKTIASLRGIVAGIRNKSPLRLSNEIELIIRRAAEAHGTPGDVTAWARRLAEDVRDLAD